MFTIYLVILVMFLSLLRKKEKFLFISDRSSLQLSLKPTSTIIISWGMF